MNPIAMRAIHTDIRVRNRLVLINENNQIRKDYLRKNLSKISGIAFNIINAV